MRVSTLALLVLVPACGGSVGAVEVASADNANGAATPTTNASYRVSFGTVSSTDGCFFFSGPGELGRDDHLGMSVRLDGHRLDWGVGVVFGAIRQDGSGLVFVREAAHDYSGTWWSRETVVLTRNGDGWVGRYHYDELAPDSTAPGTCHIDAPLSLVP